MPRYDGGKIEGVITIDGQRDHVERGYGKPSSELPLGLPGFNRNVKAGVEGHVAAPDAQRNLKHVELWINENPCGGAPRLRRHAARRQRTDCARSRRRGKALQGLAG